MRTSDHRMEIINILIIRRQTTAKELSEELYLEGFKVE